MTKSKSRHKSKGQPQTQPATDATATPRLRQSILQDATVGTPSSLLTDATAASLKSKTWGVEMEGVGLSKSPDLNSDLRRANDPLVWVRENSEPLKSKYAGKWIVIHNNKVIAHHELLAEAVEQARKTAKVRTPFVYRVQDT